MVMKTTTKMKKGFPQGNKFPKPQGHKVGGQSGLLGPDPALLFLYLPLTTSLVPLLDYFVL